MLPGVDPGISYILYSVYFRALAWENLSYTLELRGGFGNSNHLRLRWLVLKNQVELNQVYLRRTKTLLSQEGNLVAYYQNLGNGNSLFSSSLNNEGILSSIDRFI